MRVDLIKVLYENQEIYVLRLNPKAGNEQDINQLNEYRIRKRTGYEEYSYLSHVGWTDEVYSIKIDATKIGTKQGKSEVIYLHLEKQLLQWLEPGVVELQLGDDIHSFWLREEIELRDTVIDWQAPLVITDDFLSEQFTEPATEEPSKKSNQKPGRQTVLKQNQSVAAPQKTAKMVTVIGIVALLLIATGGAFWFSQQDSELALSPPPSTNSVSNASKKTSQTTTISAVTPPPQNPPASTTANSTPASAFKAASDSAVLKGNQMSVHLDILANDRKTADDTLLIKSCDNSASLTLSNNRLIYHRPITADVSDQHTFSCIISNNANVQQTTNVTVRIEPLKLSLPLEQRSTQMNLRAWLQGQTGWSLDAVNCIEQMLPSQGVEIQNNQLIYDTAKLENLPAAEKSMLCSLSTGGEWIPVTLQL